MMYIYFILYYITPNMDYYLENENMGMSLKNRELFANIGSSVKDSNFPLPKIEPNFDSDTQINTFQMYDSFLKEKDGLLHIINEICEYVTNPSTTVNTSITSKQHLIEFKNRTIMIFSSYQEQPGLLDPILPTIIPLLTNTSLKLIDISLSSSSLTDNTVITEYITCLYQIIYIICKVRGFSPIAKFFSSEVEIFEKVIHYLLKQPYEDSNTWFINYVLVLWCSILAMVPFDIDSIDTHGELINKLIMYLKEELIRSTNLRIIASYALSKFLIRPDIINKGILNTYIHDTVNALFDKECNCNIFNVLGSVLSLCDVFKNGNRKDLIKYVDTIITKLIPFEFPKAIEISGVFRKTMTKLIQRVGMILLKPRPQKWRYQLQLHNVLEKTNAINDTSSTTQMDIDDDNESELDYELDFTLLETVIDFLMNKLSDKEYIVRWSAAKGLGRICERLTKEMVEEIFHNLFDLFNDDENEFAWHGACLCIAELCKRGMILPNRLTELIPYLERALIYERNKGTFCTGSNVRDAACYIVWALARSFTVDIMKTHVDRLASTLILTILFDKEVNCRRAASAAFQENVGRQGSFPHGIEILTEADYFTLGVRANCYLNISLFIAQYDTYYYKIVDYLVNDRLVHIDKQIRELAADTLALLTPFKPQYFIDNVLNRLLQVTKHPNIHARHGALIGIGHILLGLNGKWDYYNKTRINRKRMLNSLSTKEKQIMEDSEYRKSFDKYYDSIKYINHFDKVLQHTELINSIVSVVNELNLGSTSTTKAKGNELMRSGVNEYITLLSHTEIPITNTLYLDYHDVLIENIKSTKPQIQEEACDTLRVFNKTYGKLFTSDDTVNSKLETIYTYMIKQSVIDDNISITKGYTSAIVNFNEAYITKYIDVLAKAIIDNTKLKPKAKNNDYQTRKCAVDSLGFLICNYILHSQQHCNSVDKYIDAVIAAFDDYEMDPRMGDVGSNVRISCITQIINVLLALHNESKFNLMNKYAYTAMKCVIKQLAEKMASVRRVAGNVMQYFFYELKDSLNETKLLEAIPHYNELKAMFLSDIDFDDNDKVFNMKWVEPEFAYPKIMALIIYDKYADVFIEGLFRSIACISEDVQKCSLDELKKTLDVVDKRTLITKILNVAIDIFTKNQNDDRFIEPLECALGQLLSMNMFIKNDYIAQGDKIHKCVMKENKDSTNIHKILYSVDIFYNMLFYEKENTFKVMYRCMRSLLILMCHKYPVVRKKASEKMFVFLSSVDEPEVLGVDYDQIEEANLIVAETDWTQKVANIRENRNNIAKMLNIQI